MGKYLKGVLGGFRGKVGTVVGTFVDGKAVMRSLPDFGEYKPSPAQVNANARISVVGSWLKRIKQQVRIGFQSFAHKRQTAWGAAMSYHLKHALTGVGPDYAIDFSKVMISMGELDPVVNVVVATTVDAQFDVTWVASGGSMFSGKATDRVTLMAYNPLRTEYVFARDVVPRSALGYDLEVPASWSTQLVHLWLSVTSEDGKLVSDSAYLGEFEVQ